MAKAKATTSNQKPQYKGKQYSLEEKVKYHNKMAKPGAKKTVTVDGKKVQRPVSDFMRGVHKQKADNIVKARKRAYLQDPQGRRNQPQPLV